MSKNKDTEKTRELTEAELNTSRAEAISGHASNGHTPNKSADGERS
jgi:hypothetical protein